MPAETSSKRPKIVLTDHPWPDTDLEQAIFNAAGFELIAGPVVAPSADEIAQVVAAADPVAILTCWAPVRAAAIASPRRLKVVARLGIGLDNIDVDAATARGCWVTNVPDYCVGEVSDHAVALFLAHMRGIVLFDRAAKQQRWAPEEARLQRLSDQTVGIIGYGQIGQETARKLAAFGCRVLAYSPSLKGTRDQVEVASIGRIQEEANAIFLHAPLTEQTKDLVDAKFLGLCRKKPLIINCSRGGLINNDALLEALENDAICGAALDVIEGEPSPPAKLLEHSRIIVTPHISFASSAAIDELRRRACEEVVRVLQGNPPLHGCNQPGQALDGGIASDICIVDGPGGPEVVKRALPKLRVRADWFADPARSQIEVAALRTAEEILGEGAVPKILWTAPDRHEFAMSYVGSPFENWKTRLLRGSIETGAATSAGKLLGRLHSRAAKRQDIKDSFGDLANFDELRIDPFFRKTAASKPDVANQLLEVADSMLQRRSTLVHGDYSPKNLLTDGEHAMILDWEVAHWGDPRFDVAFCISHLILKGQRAGADTVALRDCAIRFADAYRQENPGVWDIDLVRIVGALLLARISGSSPVDYLESLNVDRVQSLAIAMLNGHVSAELTPYFLMLESKNDA